MEVIEDASRSRYTDRGAWGFIAECLRSRVELKLKLPCVEYNDYAYVLKKADGYGARRIYMKVAI